jgi:hypothetical protein
MITTYQLALMLRRDGKSEEEIVPILQQITGKDKPGAADPIPKEIASQIASPLDEETIAKVAGVAQGAGFSPELALEGGYQPPTADQTANRVKPNISTVPNAQATGTAGDGGFMPTPTGADVSPAEDIYVSKEGPKPFHSGFIKNIQPQQSLKGQSTQALGLLDQGQPQPTAPAPQQNKGLMSQGLDSLKSIGRGMGDYAGKLFDDPNRMALLQGGLSMMDPNSYYDKQGFGSVFTGLNKGLGAAQAGHKGVFDRRQAIANLDKTRAESAYALSGKGGAGSSEYERLSKVTMDPNATPMQKQLAQQRIDKLTESEGSGSMDRQESKYIFEQLPEAQKTVQSLRKLTHAIGLVDSDTGIMTGPGTNPLIGFGNFLVSKMGMDLGDNETQRLEGTREYIAIMGSQVADAITAFGAGTGLSDADRTFAEGMVGADPSKFTKAGLKKLLMFNELNSRMKVTEYNSIASEVASRDTKHKYLVRKLPPMSKALRDHIIANKKNGLLGDNPEKPAGWVGDWDAIKAGKAQGTSPSSGGFTIELYEE